MSLAATRWVELLVAVLTLHVGTGGRCGPGIVSRPHLPILHPEARRSVPPVRFRSGTGRGHDPVHSRDTESGDNRSGRAVRRRRFRAPVPWSAAAFPRRYSWSRRQPPGAESLERIGQVTPDVLIVDVGLTGYRRARSLSGPYRAIIPRPNPPRPHVENEIVEREQLARLATAPQERTEPEQATPPKQTASRDSHPHQHQDPPPDQTPHRAPSTTESEPRDRPDEAGRRQRAHPSPASKRPTPQDPAPNAPPQQAPSRHPPHPQTDTPPPRTSARRSAGSANRHRRREPKASDIQLKDRIPARDDRRCSPARPDHAKLEAPPAQHRNRSSSLQRSQGDQEHLEPE